MHRSLATGQKAGVGFVQDGIDADRHNGAMTIRDLFPAAADQVVGIVKRADSGDLTKPTPCTDFDLKTLVNHFIGTTGALVMVARRVPMDPDDPYGSQKDSTQGDWQATLASNIDDLSRSWADPQAWEGSVDMGGGNMPATMIGEMALAETLLHGWDLARATGQQLTVSDNLGSELRRSIEETAELGRTVGAYGEAVDVGEAASEFERALAASGRDPRWGA